MSFPATRHSSIVQEYFVQRLRQADAKRLAARAKVKTRKDALRLQAQVRSAIAKCFGPLPAKTPLNARVTGTIEHETYVIEKVIYESRPGFMVTANLYVPRAAKALPAVLFTCGHSQDAKAYDVYQTAQHGLAMKGFVVLAYDPISQGERVQYPNEKGLPTQGLCDEHTQIGRQQGLLGEFFGTWRAWDGIRGVDYLVSRPEVDPARIAVLGQSGGGTMTTWLTALEPRFAMSAPACFTTTLLCNLENENAADAEQIPPRLVEMGLDQFELLIPHAPKPLILLTAENDFFDQRGAQEAYRQLKRIWALLGKEENIRIVTAPGGHSLSQPLREAVYGWFGKHAGLKVAAKEPAITLHKEAELLATPEGSTLKAGSKRVFDFTVAKAAAVEVARKPVPASKLPAMLTDLLALPSRQGVPHHRVLPPRGDGKRRWQSFPLETEPGILCMVTMLLKEGESAFRVPEEAECTLVVPHGDTYKDMNALASCDQDVLKGRAFGVDYRGVGESLPDVGWGGAPGDTHPSDYFHQSYGLMFGEPYLGRRIHDVLRTIDWLRAHKYKKIHLLGRGMGAIIACLAGAIDRKLAGVTLVNGLLSWTELTQTPIFAWNSSCLPFGILNHLDLPDCLRAIGPKLKLVRPCDAQMTPLPAEVARRRVAELGLKCELVVESKPHAEASGSLATAPAIA